MKKTFLSALLVFVFIISSCSSDDDGGSEANCQTCVLELVNISTEYCDNGDGTMNVTIDGVSQTQDLEGVTFNQFIEGIGSISTCN